MSLLKKRIQAKKMGEQRKLAPASPLTDKPRIVAGLGIVLDTTKSEEFMAGIDRRISFKSRFAKETKDRQQKLAEMRGEVATAQKEKAAKPTVSISDSESRLKSRADKGNSSQFPIPSQSVRARMCAKAAKWTGNAEADLGDDYGDVQIIADLVAGETRPEGGEARQLAYINIIRHFDRVWQFNEKWAKKILAAWKGKNPESGRDQTRMWMDHWSKSIKEGRDINSTVNAAAAADPAEPEGITDSLINEGAAVEKEHGATYENIKAYYAEHGEFPPFDTVTEWIAIDHLKEFADYYDALDKMEKELKAAKKPEAEAMKASAAKTVTFQTKNGKEGTVAVSKATNFDYRISKKEAERLLKEFGYDLPFDIMCKEYGEDEDWVGVVVEDLNEDGTLDDDYKTFELNGGNLPPAKAMRAKAGAKTEKAIRDAVNAYWEPKLGDRGNRLINWLNADLYHGPYAAGTTDEEDNPNATYPGFTAAIDELREIIDNAGGFQDMYYDNDTGELTDKEPEAFEDEETGEMIEPYLEETYHLEGRDVARDVLGKELVSYVI